MTKSESAIQSQIIKMLNQLPKTYVVKYHATAYSTSGVADLLICSQGKFIAMEVKSEKGYQSELQKLQQKKVISAGGTSVVVRSCDEAREVMQEVLNRE